jgi:hypothetical protein
MLTMLAASFACAEQVQPTGVDTEQSRAWVRWATPLPKSISLDSKVVLSPKQVAVSYAEPADALVAQAAKELRAAIGSESEASAAFTIRLQVGGPESEPLRGMQNSDQAYLIQPSNGDLRLVGLTPTGVYYAAKTLGQLIKAKANDQQVEIPLVTAKDWPDLARRGMWGADTHAWISWMSDHKFNMVSQISALEVDSAGRGHAKHKAGRESLVEEAPLRAVAPAPVVLHLEQVSGKGVLAAYPNLKAKGGREGTLCYSQPQIVDILADWYVDLAKLPGVKSVEQWLAENLGGQGGCRCPECSKTDRDLLELQVVLKAWEKAKQRVPGLDLGISTTEETAENNDKIFAALPKGVHAWYYHSLLTYCTSHNPMVTKAVGDFAAHGGQIGTVPSLCSNVNFAGPFTGPQFVHDRMNELVDKKLCGMLAYPSPGMDFTKFNVEAMAEWAWNAKGRSVREFAISWAVRNGLKDPELFADWCEANGPVAWDVYGSCWPEYQKRRNPMPIAQALKKRQLPSLEVADRSLFRGPWGDFRSPDQFRQDVASAARAVELARKLGKPEYEAESLVVQGYMNALNALWELNKIVTSQGVPADQRDHAKSFFEAFDQGLNQAGAALPKWVANVSPGTPSDGVLSEPTEVIAKLRKSMSELAAEMGVR